MKRGEMDPEGEGTTRAGWICGIISVAVGALLLITCGSLLTTAVFSGR